MVYILGSFFQQAWAGKEGNRDPMSLGGRARRESTSLEPAGAEATSAAAGGRERGHLTKQVVGLAGSQVLALGGWPHGHQAGTSNALTAWLARRAQPALRGKGAPGRKDGVQEADPQKQVSPASESRVQPPQGGPSGLSGVCSVLHLLPVPVSPDEGTL